MAEIATKFVLISGEKVTSSTSKSLFTVMLILRNLTTSRVTTLIGQYLIDGKQSLHEQEHPQFELVASITAYARG